MLGLNRGVMASELRIGASRLKSYERGDVPVPYYVAERLASFFNLSLSWLAEGNGEQFGSIVIHSEQQSQIAQRALFSEVYMALIKPELSRSTVFVDILKKKASAFADAGMSVEVIPNIGLPTGPTQAAISKMAGAILKRLPPHLVSGYFNAFVNASNHFESIHADEIGSWGNVKGPEAELQKATPQKELLTQYYAIRNTPEVQQNLTWTSLIRRLLNVISEHGKKAELAREINVPLPRISELLAGKWEPGGERTLRLLKWVTEQEKATNLKSPGGARNTTGAETRPKRTNAKPKSGPT